MDCVVIGAGVSGLSSAIRLLEAGHSVRVLAREFSPDLVSDVAAALWYPFLAHPIEKTDRWGAETYTCLLYTSPSPRDKRQSRMPSAA